MADGLWLMVCEKMSFRRSKVVVSSRMFWNVFNVGYHGRITKKITSIVVSYVYFRILASSMDFVLLFLV